MPTAAPDDLALIPSSPAAAPAHDVLATLNPAQREAAQNTRGPLAIVAGAGTGKTTTITHRIAHQVHSGAFAPRQILAVTFTAKAAGVLRSRLAQLGVRGVEARTFHAAALWQLGVMHEQYIGRSLERVLASKARLLQPLVSRLPAPFKFRPVREFAGEIEWAKNRLVSRTGYADAIEAMDRTPPVPPDILDRVWRGYEQALEHEGVLDFEDLLGRVVTLFDEHPAAVERIRTRFQSFTVDEYQDVNPLQQALLDRWLGDRDELCVVGDDYQTVYSFTGADPHYLLGFADRFPGARIVRLEDNYRSTAQVLQLANGLVDRLGGFEKRLVAHRPDGPAPQLHVPADAAAEAALVVERCRALQAEGSPLSEVAVLYRTNARSEPFEAALAQAGIPFQVKDGSFLQRPAARAVLDRLTRRAEQPLPDVFAQVLAEVGFDPDAEVSGDERTRQDDLVQLQLLAREFAGGSSASLAGEPGPLPRSPVPTARAFVADLRARFTGEQDASGVQLMTLHRAKGLEFDVVFLPALLENELPYRHRGVSADVVEERRLLYVGITRARRELHLSAPLTGKPSRFLAELGLVAARSTAGASASGARSAARPIAELDGEAAQVAEQLRAWRLERAKADGVPAYVVCTDATLAQIATELPSTLAALSTISGIGPAKLERYGPDLLAAVTAARASTA